MNVYLCHCLIQQLYSHTHDGALKYTNILCLLDNVDTMNVVLTMQVFVNFSIVFFNSRDLDLKVF